jgi:cobalamin biosynthesis protein CbiD
MSANILNSPEISGISPEAVRKGTVAAAAAAVVVLAESSQRQTVAVSLPKGVTLEG